ncbi:MAG: hypothetical protein R2758_16830 [Bacteroidales bacterium]
MSRKTHRNTLASLKHLADIPELAFNSTNQLITLSNLETQKYIEVNQAFLETTGSGKKISSVKHRMTSSYT